MITILEGPDGAGKTHLATQLCQRYDAVYHHEGPPPNGIAALTHYGSLLQRARETGENHVFDRLALGERVYGPIFRGKDTLGETGLRLFRRVVRAAGAIEIVCLPPFETVLKHWREKKEDMNKDPGTLRQVYDSFNELSRDGRTLTYDWTRDNEEFLIDLVGKCGVDRLPEHFIGDPGAKFLIVGDRGSEPRGSTANLAFFGETNSSGWLDRMLRLAGFEEHELIFTNAWTWCTGTEMFTKPTLIGPPRPNMTVIALGTAAQAMCKELVIEHHVVPHPQYWRRFFAKDEDGYANRLKACRKSAKVL